jgi:hypothetical protein
MTAGALLNSALAISRGLGRSMVYSRSIQRGPGDITTIRSARKMASRWRIDCRLQAGGFARDRKYGRRRPACTAWLGFAACRSELPSLQSTWTVHFAFCVSSKSAISRRRPIALINCRPLIPHANGRFKVLEACCRSSKAGTRRRGLVTLAGGTARFTFARAIQKFYVWSRGRAAQGSQAFRRGQAALLIRLERV